MTRWRRRLVALVGLAQVLTWAGSARAAPLGDRQPLHTARPPLPILLRDAEVVAWVEALGSYAEEAGPQDDRSRTFVRARVVRLFSGPTDLETLEYLVRPERSCKPDDSASPYVPFPAPRPELVILGRITERSYESGHVLSQEEFPDQGELVRAIEDAFSHRSWTPARMRDWLIALLDASPPLRKLALEDLIGNRYVQPALRSSCSPPLSAAQRAAVRSSYVRRPIVDRTLVGILALAGHDPDPEFDRQVMVDLDESVAAGRFDFEYTIDRPYFILPTFWEWRAMKLFQSRLGFTSDRFPFCESLPAPPLEVQKDPRLLVDEWFEFRGAASERSR